LQRRRANSYRGYAAIAQEVDNQKILDKNDPILIENLTKQFGAFKAVDNISFSIKEGEIFTILGHNGAGKTTAIFMLTGMLTPTSGDATVYGNKLSKDIDSVQQNLGLCQQFDVLFDLLTVEEHLQLVCELKNIPVERKAELIKETLSIVMLTEHQ
jgi:ABC-type multidrug transport system ATPase subunit